MEKQDLNIRRVGYLLTRLVEGKIGLVEILQEHANEFNERIDEINLIADGKKWYIKKPLIAKSLEWVNQRNLLSEAIKRIERNSYDGIPWLIENLYKLEMPLAYWDFVIKDRSERST